MGVRFVPAPKRNNFRNKKMGYLVWNKGIFRVPLGAYLFLCRGRKSKAYDCETDSRGQTHNKLGLSHFTIIRSSPQSGFGEEE